MNESEYFINPIKRLNRLLYILSILENLLRIRT